MAQKRPRRRAQRGASDETGSPGQVVGPGNPTGRPWPPDGSPPPEIRPRREIRPYVYAAFDFAMAIVYAVLLTQAPTRHTGGTVLLWSTVVAVALAGIGMLWRNRWGWRLAAGGCALLLAVTVIALVLILLSASFLAGVYGAMGRGAATMALLAGALAIELCGLLPAFQLKFLRTRAGRRYFERAAPRAAEPAG